MQSTLNIIHRIFSFMGNIVSFLEAFKDQSNTYSYDTDQKGELYELLS